MIVTFLSHGSDGFDAGVLPSVLAFE